MDVWMRSAHEMVDTQLISRGIGRKAVLEAMRAVPRHLFVPDEYRSMAYSDCALPIGNGQTISQPYIVAKMTELLDPEHGDQVLEIGTGSGYQAAVLAEMGVHVISIERISPLAQRASSLLGELGYPVTVLLMDGRYGYKDNAPYTGIIVTAAAEKIEEAWFDQLAQGGKLVVPLRVGTGMERLLSREKKDGKIRDLWFDYCHFVPVLPGTEEG